jgi:chemotaxis family two-component system response regulator Rcp1
MQPVLLVEDDPVDVAFVREVIAQLSLVNLLDVATSAETAKMYLARVTPTLVISDIHLPRANGIELLHWIRLQPPPLGDVPVVMLTGSTDLAHQLHASALRALLFFNKPIRGAVLLDALRGLGVLVTETPKGRVLSMGNRTAV